MNLITTVKSFTVKAQGDEPPLRGLSRFALKKRFKEISFSIPKSVLYKSFYDCKLTLQYFKIVCLSVPLQPKSNICELVQVKHMTGHHSVARLPSLATNIRLG